MKPCAGGTGFFHLAKIEEEMQVVAEAYPVADCLLTWPWAALEEVGSLRAVAYYKKALVPVPLLEYSPQSLLHQPLATDNSNDQSLRSK
jgi:hypothetical protein